MKRGYISWLLIFFLIFFLLISMFPSGISTSYSTGFEDGTLTEQYDAGWIVTSTDAPLTIYVDDTNPHTGTKAYKTHTAPGATGCWFNYTYPTDEFMYNWSIWFCFVSGADDDYLLTFENSTGTSIITFRITLDYIDASNSNLKVEFLSATTGYNVLEESGGSDWHFFESGGVAKELNLGFNLNSADNVTYFFNSSQEMGAPAVVANLPRITNVHFAQGVAGYITNVDDNIISTNYGYATTGNVTVNVYNESDPSVAIPDWSLKIYDSDGIIHYTAINLDNPVDIDHSVYGTGVTFFEINATGYDTRTYYFDAVSGIDYTLNAFLPPGPDANIYSLIVVDDSDLYSIQYINDAKIVITRWINGSMHEIASGTTDYSGRYYVSLIPGVTYFVNISATGYLDSTHTYVPSSTVFEHTFHISATSTGIKSYDEFFENVTISIDMVSAGCLQDGNITVTYLDSNSSTTNTQIRLYEIHGTTNTLLNTWSNTSNSFFNINGSINTTRMHFITIFFNNTADFGISQPVTIMILNVDSPLCSSVTPFDLDDRIDDIIGPFTIGDKEIPWTSIIGIIIPIVVLVSFGPFNTGLGIIGCGISMTMMQGFLDTYVSGGFNWAIAGIGVFIIIIGILYVMTKGTGVDQL